MSTKKNKSSLSWNGVTQSHRLLKALIPEYIKVDERSTSDLLAFSAKYAEMVQFYDQTNSPAGDWSRFLRNDLSVFLASIIATDLKKIEQEHAKYIAELENAARTAGRLEALKALYTQVFDMAKQFNDWYVHALKMNTLQPGDTDELENELENAIKQQLSSNLIELLEQDRFLEFHQTGTYSPNEIEEHFHRIWFPSKKLLSARAIEVEDPRANFKIQDYTKKIRLQFRTFYSVLSYIVQEAPKYLEKSLKEKDDHRPDLALFIAFVKLFKHNQDHLNTLTEKHLDFYYYDVLKMQERGLQPDQVNVYFNLAKHIDSFFLPAGTLLDAGVDEEGNPIRYKTDYGIELNQAKVDAVKTLFVSKNPKIGIGSSYRLITNMYAAPIANSRDGLGKRFINNEEEWPAFGEELLEKAADERQMVYAEVGWAMAAPILEMEEGHRSIKLRMRFDKSSMYTLNLLIKDISRNQGLSKEDAFSKVFKNSLKLVLSGEEGWIEAKSCELLPPENWNIPEFSLLATVSANAPAIVGYNANVLGPDFDTSLPVMKVLHKNENVTYSYSFLKELSLERINIDVEVKGIKRLNLSNEYGQLEGSIPFQAFGPTPKLGSYLLIGKTELFKKELTNLKININWHNLPDNTKGLRGYYREYGLGIRNEDYRIKLSALREGEFFPENKNNVKEYFLFEQDEDNVHGISNATCLDNIELKLFDLEPQANLKQIDTYTSETQTGYFRMELTNPPSAFAHDEFPNLYADVAAHNADPKTKEKKKLPNQPFTPVIRNMSIDYTATAQVNIMSIGTVNSSSGVAEELFHIHPFGVMRNFSQGRPIKPTLLPAYDEDAYLFLGIKNFNPPATLSIYFELKENQDYFSMMKGRSSEAKQAEIVWSFLVNDEWKEFSQTQILNDTTNFFNNSGIITFDIPRDISDNNTIFDKGKFWLRASLRGDASRMPTVLHLSTQAISATWAGNPEEEVKHLEEKLAANKIKNLASPLVQIRSVQQPFGSFEGRPGENKKEFYTRSSERLRHKGRAVSAWDYERLVLDQFPDIFQVKCVMHIGNEAFVEKGEVVLVVVPRIKASHQGRLPMVNNATLEAIRDYLIPLASPFVNIKLRNPIYERVKVAGGLRFQKGMNNGTFLKKLNKDIMDFVCPWMYGGQRELELGGTMAKDVLLSFIEKREYVDFVTKFSAVQVFPSGEGFDVGDTAIDNSSSPLLKATTPWSVLIPFEKNPLYLLDEVAFQSPAKAGLDNMMLDGDFVMTEERELDD